MATSGSGSASTSDASDSRPVKLLCSLGGRILPRPSDGALRYAEGDNRVISLARNSPLPLLFTKLADAYSLSSNFLLRYQLPDEGLDILVSLSTEEDLENMMDEYDRITGASPKLRVFLFPVSDPSPSSDAIDHADSDSSLSMEEKEGNFLDMVRTTFEHQPEKYEEYVEMLEDFEHVRANKELLKGFNELFLPQQYKGCGCLRGLDFVNAALLARQIKIRRFKPYVSLRFSRILELYKKGFYDRADASLEISMLFWNHLEFTWTCWKYLPPII